MLLVCRWGRFYEARVIGVDVPDPKQPRRLGTKVRCAQPSPSQPTAAAALSLPMAEVSVKTSGVCVVGVSGVGYKKECVLPDYLVWPLGVTPDSRRVPT